ncbi:MAG TPA: tautomerase family protein [Solirubrobacteraceae bacterium]|nr:tautomerase family protein [Solirubrobacteraceae bacterium]
MPIVEIKLFDSRINDETVPQLIQKVTDAVVECTSEAIRDETWVVVQGLPPKQWGVGGKPLG